MPLQRQDRLEFALAALFGRTAGGISLNDVELTLRRVLLLTVSELPGQAERIEHALAARHLARLARGFACTRSLDDLRGDNLGVVRAFEQKLIQFGRNDFLHDRLHFARYELVLGLRREFGFRHLD